MSDDQHKTYVTIYESSGGWKAIMLWWNPELGGFWEPMSTGCGAYNTREEAEDEARWWAKDEGLEYREKES